MSLTNLHTDRLTGLLSRRAFEAQFEALINKSLAKESPFSLAFFDIDRFLEVNDQLGHAKGDVIIKKVAEIIQEIAGEAAIVSRYGGDEFALLFPGMEREPSFLKLEQVRVAIEEKETYSEVAESFTLKLTVSAGIASFPVDGRTESELLRKADQAIYRAKALGGNQVKLAYEERMVPKTTHYTQTQLERLSKLAEKEGLGEAVLLREALDNLLLKYRVTSIDSRVV